MSNGAPAKAKISGRMRKKYREVEGGGGHSPCKFKKREGTIGDCSCDKEDKE